MRFSFVFYLCGLVLALFGTVMLCPAALDAIDHNTTSMSAFLYSAGISLAVGLFIILFAKRHWDRISTKEMFLSTSCVWFCTILCCTLPFVFNGISFTDAFFEATSGLTTTGATVLERLDNMSRGILLWRAITHWFGGIGIVILAVMVMPVLHIGGMQMFATESSDTSAKDVPQIAKRMQRICLIYLGVSVACATCLYFGGMSVFDAIAHAMSTVSTGGFSTHDASIAYFDGTYIPYIIMVFMFIAALPFMYMLAIVTGRWRRVRNDMQPKTFALIIAGACLALGVYCWQHTNTTFPDALSKVSFAVISLTSGTGFVWHNYLRWGTFIPAALFFLTAVGGCTGSSAGGLKIFRIDVLVQALRRHLKLMVNPHAVVVPRYNDQPITNDVIAGVMVFLAVFMVVVMFSTLCLSLLGENLADALSASLSCIANVGPGVTDKVSPVSTFAVFSTGAKWVLSVVMLLGRLEFMTITVLLWPTLWLKK